jgi:hypothetical protein
MFRPVDSVVLAAILAMLLPVSARAEEADLKAEVAQLFQLGWQPSLDAQTAAQEQAFKLVEMAPADPRLAYAYALVQIRQRKYAEADRLVNRFLVKEKEDFYAWRTKIWLSVLQKQYDAAKMGMDRASQLFSQDGPQVAESEAILLRQEMAGFLGRTAGFLAGPAGDQGGALRLAEQQEKILGRLNEQQREAFLNGRDQVMTRYSELTGEGAQTKEQALVDAETRKREVRAELEKQEERIAAERAEVEPLREKLESEFRSELADLELRARPLLERMTRLESQGAVVRQQAFGLAAEIEELQRRAARTKEPLERDRLLRQADRLTVFYRQYEAQLRGLEIEARGVAAQRNQLLLQQQQTQARYQADMGRLAGRIEESERGLQRISAEHRKLSKPVSGNTPRVRELARVATALTTYEQLPLDQERQRILASFD